MHAHSFAVMAYGESPYLEACIKSLLDQAAPGGIYVATSTPCAHITGIAQKHGLALHVNPQRTGIVSDWNFAMDMCRTPYLTLAHQDDVYYPAYTRRLLSDMQKQKDALIAFCDYEEIAGGAARSQTSLLRVKRLLLWPFAFKSRLDGRLSKRMILRFGSPVCCPSVMYNMQACRLRFDASYCNNMDWDAWLRLCDQKGGFVYVRERLMAHRIHADSETTRQIACEGRRTEDLRMFLRLWPAPVAKLLARLYCGSYASNKIPEEKT